jgi:hypothetical protein
MQVTLVPQLTTALVRVCAVLGAVSADHFIPPTTTAMNPGGLTFNRAAVPESPSVAP